MGQINEDLTSHRSKEQHIQMLVGGILRFFWVNLQKNWHPAPSSVLETLGPKPARSCELHWAPSPTIVEVFYGQE